MNRIKTLSPNTFLSGFAFVGLLLAVLISLRGGATIVYADVYADVYAEDDAVASVTITQVAKALAGDANAQEFFGRAVAMDGDTAVVGAWGKDQDGSTPDVGAAYVFYRNQGGADKWGQVKKLSASDPQANARFGHALAIGGDIIVICAERTSGEAGAVYLFARNQGGTDNWGLLKRLTPGDAAANKRFGAYAAISGDLLIVGAEQDTDRGVDAGAVYIFARNQGGTDNWGLIKKIYGSDTTTGDLFGDALALDGEVLVVGARQNDATASQAGAAYIFARNQGGTDNWGQVKRLIGADTVADDAFGHGVSISGTTVAVGAPATDQGALGAGALYLFERDQGGSNNWGQIKKLVASTPAAGDALGRDLAIDGDTIVAGADEHDANGKDSGAVYLFQRDEGGTNNWGEVQKVLASDGNVNDWFGKSVYLSGTTFVVGAFKDEQAGVAAGSAYFFAVEQPTLAFDCASNSQIPQAECEALAALYTSTNGDGWINKEGWLQNNTPCGWFGITCGGGRVTALSLPANNLTGPIPAALSNLANLELLELYQNRLNSGIPAGLGSLSQLKQLSLYNNDLSSQIPTTLGNLTNLEGLRLGHNRLSGGIPKELGNLTKLTVLGLDDNQLTGSIPRELGNLTQLTLLNMDRNHLTGSIPVEFGNFPTTLWRLWLENNQLSGAIPSQIGNLTGLRNFSVENNALEGAIPTSLTALTSMTSLKVGYNRLTASGTSLRAYLNSKDADWEQTQTVPPANLQASAQSANSIQVSWTPIAYTSDGGYYEISTATGSGGPYTVRSVTANKSTNSYTITGLSANTRYYIVIRTYTPAHGDQSSNLWSSYSTEASATTQQDTSNSPPNITSTPGTSGLAGQQYTYSVVASGSAPLTYKLLSAPATMSINANSGLIQWTPDAPGTVNVQVEVSNAFGQDSQSFTITVRAAPRITTTPIRDGAKGQPYAYDVDAVGDPAPTFALTQRPSGMTINSTSGLIGWTPTASGQFSVTVQASNAVGTDSQTFAINVQETVVTVAPKITSSPTTSAVINQPYSYDVAASGSPPPQYKLLTAPTGMTINLTTGMISWTPTQSGQANVTVEARNSANADTQSFTINVTGRPDGDKYEEDDTCDSATTIPTNSTIQAHTFHDAGDADWLLFEAQSGKSYIIEVNNVGAKANAVILLYDTCDRDPSDTGDNSFGSSVRLEWDSTKNGRYFIKLQQNDGSFFGSDTSYQVAVTEDNFAPSAPKDPRCLAIDDTTLGIQWKRNPERDVQLYRVNYRRSDGGVSGLPDVPGAGTTYVELSQLTANADFELNVRAVDFSGNESTPSGTISCRTIKPVDTSQPSLSVRQPTASAVYTTTASQLTVSGIVQDSGGNLSRVQVRNITRGIEKQDSSLAGSNDDFRITDLDLGQGDNRIEVTAFDEASNFTKTTMTVRRVGNATPGAVIIIAGHNETFSLQSNIYNATNRAYRIFQSAGFTDDDIYYIAPVDQDPDRDGSADEVDAKASPAAVQEAFTVWAKGKVGAGKPLYVYMMDHGFADKFCVSGCSDAGRVRPVDVDGWLRNLEQTTGVNQVNIIIEACQSGSFLDRHNGDVANSLSKVNRVVVTSTSRDLNAYASAQGAYFSDEFFSCLADSNNIKVCFEQGKQAVATTGVAQEPWMDDNGDGLYDSKDGSIAQNRTVTRFFSSVRPTILETDVTLRGKSGTLTAKVEDGTENIDLVWAAVYPPSFQEPDDVTINLNVPTVRLEPDPNQEGVYRVEYPNGFEESSNLEQYRIVFYAQDRLGINATPRRLGQTDEQFVYLPLLRR